KGTKGIFWGFNLAFLALLGYTSVIIGAVFVQHIDAGGTMAHDMAILGINTQWFVFERAALATGLLVLMATDRAMERWRMQLVPVNAVPTQREIVEVSPQPQLGTAQSSDLEKLLESMMKMNQQNLQAMQQMNQHSLNVTIEQFTKVTIEAVRETVGQVVDALPTYTPPQIAAPSAQEAKTGQSAGEKPDMPEQGGTKADEKPDVPVSEKRSYGDAIEALYLKNPGITPDEILIELGCSKSTATTWLRRCKPMQ